MLQLTYLFVGVLAVLASGVTFSQGIDQHTRTITATFAMAVWAYWAITSYSVEVVTSGGVRTHTYGGLAAIGIAAAAIMLLSAAMLAWGLLGSDSTDPDQEMRLNA